MGCKKSYDWNFPETYYAVSEEEREQLLTKCKFCQTPDDYGFILNAEKLTNKDGAEVDVVMCLVCNKTYYVG